MTVVALRRLMVLEVGIDRGMEETEFSRGKESGARFVICYNIPKI
jgi:hypothetical protein